MKYTEIKELTLEELKERLQTEKENLQRLKFGHSISPIENPMQIREARKSIARLKTAINSKTAEKQS